MAKIKINIKLKKKTLLILIPVVVLLVAGIVGTTVFMTKKKAADEKPAAPPAYYVSKKEGLSSITAIVGDRAFEDLALAEKEQAKLDKKAREAEEKEAKKAEKAAKKEAKKAEKEAKKAAKEKKKEEAATEGEGDKDSSEKEETSDTASASGEESAASEEETAEESTSSEPADKYRYFDVEDAEKDVQDYINYLETEKNFIEIENNVGASEEAEEKSEDAKEDAKEDGVESFRLAGPSQSPEAYLTVTIEKEKDSYIITASKGAEAWNSYLTKLWNEQKEAVKQAEKKADDPKTSREQAEDTVSGLSQEELGLPEPADQYEFITAMGLMSLNGKSYYPVRAYKRQPDDSLWFMGTYLMDFDSKTVPYKYDESTGVVDPLS